MKDLPKINLKEIKSILITFIISITVFIIAVLSIARVDQLIKQKNQLIKNEAVDSCLKAGLYTTETTAQWTTVKTDSVEPMKNWYKFCMTQKGY